MKALCVLIAAALSLTGCAAFSATGDASLGPADYSVPANRPATHRASGRKIVFPAEPAATPAPACAGGVCPLPRN